MITRHFLKNYPHRRLPYTIWLVIFPIFLLREQCTADTINSTVVGSREIFISGDIVLGGLLPIFVSGKDGKCSINSALGIPQLEALLFSLDLINGNTSILPNITLGVKAFDTCGSETTALDRAVKGFVLGEEFVPGLKVMQQRPVVGVIGPGYSYEAVHVSPFLGVFNIPLISYGATSPVLSDKVKFEYFSRTIPGDSQQARVILELLREFNWTYVSLVYSDEPYGRSGFDFIKAKAKHYGICFAKMRKLSKKYSRSMYREAVRHILMDKDAKTVVIFCIESAIPPFMMEVRRQMRSRRLQFIGSETLAMLIEWDDVRSVATGIVFTLPASNPVPAFIEYFYDLSIDNNARNPWFRGFFEDTANCTTGSQNTGLPLCNSSLTLKDINYSVEVAVFNSIPFVIDSVFVFVHALRIALEQFCGKYDRVNCNIPGKELLRIIRTSTVHSFTGVTVNISDTGDVMGGYDIYHMDEIQPGLFENIKVGERRDKLNIFPGKWKFFDVESHCWETCAVNEIRKAVPGMRCCSQCVACLPDFFPVNETACGKCILGYQPDITRKICIPSPIKYFTIDGKLVSFSFVLPPLILSCVLIIGLLCTMIVFLWYNSTPLVKASARELSYLLLLGLFLSNLFPFISIMKPSTFTCFLQLFLDSVPFTICLVAIAVKNNRTYRIFNPRRDLTSTPLLVNPRAQMVISLILIFVQIFLLTLIVMFEFPRAKFLYPSSAEVHLVCIITVKQRHLTHLYNVSLLLVCTYYAYKTRNLPRNFNEAKYICFAMYGSCVIFFAFLIVSLTAIKVTSDSYQPTFTSYRIVLTETILFVNFFFPKIYIILWKPEQNKKHSTTETPVDILSIAPGAPPSNSCQYQCHSTYTLFDKMKRMKDQSTQTE